MKKINLLILIIALFTFSCQNQVAMNAQSPDGDINITFVLDQNGTPTYNVEFSGNPVIEPSKMGFEFQGQESMLDGFQVINIDRTINNESWEMPWGEQLEVRNEYQELTIALLHTSSNRELNIIFRAYDDGVAFRYEFPEQENMNKIVITQEKSEFNLTGNHKVWWIPGDWDIYEYLYNTTQFSEIDAPSKFIEGDHLGQTYIHSNAVNTPVTMKTANGTYLSFHEADLTNYAGMTLKVDTDSYQMVSELVGNDSGIKATVSAPFKTPWRTIQMADRAGDLIESNLIVNLNDPNEMGDVSWFKPMKYLGIWWDMHIGTKTWDYASGNHGATTEYTKAFIDFAAEHGFGGVLVEGWNTGWEVWTDPVKRDGVFDFTTPYEDYDLAYLAGYAKEKGVQIIMHHETSAAVTQYDARMDTAYQLMKALGINSVKTGYVGAVIPEGEYHHGQWMVNHYQRTLDMGAKYQVAINMHEPIKATGLRRTYPNMISREGARGQEYNAWAADGGNPAEHIPIVAFTRMLSGPFDFTPGVFDITLPTKPDNQINTTLAQQLALYVVIYSPIQMACDLMENYEGNPAFQFIKDVGVDWKQTKVLDGEIGDFVVIAREERETGNWFIGAANDENEREITIDFSFLETGKAYTAKIYQDAEDAHFRDNPTSILISEEEISSTASKTFKLAAGGGLAISLQVQ